MQVWSGGPFPQLIWLASHLLAQPFSEFKIGTASGTRGHMLGPTERNTSQPLTGKISLFVIKLLRSSSKPSTNDLSSGQLQTILSYCFSLLPCLLPQYSLYYCSLESFPNKVPLCMCLSWAPFSEKYKLTYCVYFVLDWIKLYEIVNIWPFLTYKNGYFLLSD